MKLNLFVVVAALMLLTLNATALQPPNYPPEDSNNQPPRFELGLAFSGIHLSDNNNFGVGARAVFNLNSFFALEGEGNFFLNDAAPKLRSGGRAIEGLFGPKIG